MTKLLSKKIQITILVAAAVVVAAGIVFALAVALQPVVPPGIKKQLSIAVLYPKDNTFAIDHSSWKYDKSLGLLTYLVRDKDNNAKITVSEQSSPPQFSEVPGTLDALTSKLNTYADFDSIDGHAYLTHPKELKGGQSALMNAKGTLMFAKPDKNLSDSDWHKFFNAIDIVR